MVPGALLVEISLFSVFSFSVVRLKLDFALELSRSKGKFFFRNGSIGPLVSKQVRIRSVGDILRRI